jgi:hypothetical protein
VTRALTIGLFVASGVLVDATLACAQGMRSDRPFRALFGRGNAGTGGQTVDLSATMVEAYDDNLLAEVGGVTAGSPAVGGQYTMVQAGGKYSWIARRVEIGITGASAFRSYNLGTIRSVSQSAGFGLSATLPGRTQLAVNQSAAYSPSYLAGLFPSLADPGLGDTRPTSPNYAVDDFASTSYTTSAAVSRGLTRRGSIMAGADYTVTDFRGNSAARPDGSTRGLSTAFSHLVGRHSALSADYRYRTGNFGFGADTSSTEHAVNLGATHTRVLSATRRAEFSFGVGVSTSNVPAQLAQVTPALPGDTSRLYRVVGDGSLAYQFSRTGQFRTSYRRGVEYIVELGQPVFTDGLSASVGSSVTRRLDLTVAAGYSKGAGALQRGSNFDTYTADIVSHVSLTRTLAVYAEYLYYFYDFGAATILAPNVARRLERNGIRVGLTVSTPLVRK